MILSILLISQFWTLANDVYDPRQAKRIFGFIGGGASLGGATGAGLTALLASGGRVAQADPDVRRRDVRLPRHRHRDRAAGEIRRHVRRVEDRRGGRRERRRSHSPAALVATPADHLARDRVRRDGVEHRRPAGQHGGGRVQRRRRRRCHCRLPRATDRLPVADRLRDPGHVDQPHSPRPRHRLCPADAAGQHGRRRHADPAQPRALGAERRPHHRHLDSLHDRQDVARSPVPAAAGRSQVPRQAVCRRDDGSIRQGRCGGADARVHQGLGLWPRLAATELRQPGADRGVGRGGHRREARVHAIVPAQHRTANRRTHAVAVHQSRSVVGRDAGHRAGASRSQARVVRDRSARRDGQAPSRHAAAARP